MSDVAITERQKHVLLDIYASFLVENEALGSGCCAGVDGTAAPVAKRAGQEDDQEGHEDDGEEDDQEDDEAAQDGSVRQDQRQPAKSFRRNDGEAHHQ